MNFEEINEFAKRIAEILKDGDVIALVGDLGTGKTTFVKEVAKNLGVREIVKSPTFNIVHEYYSGRLPLFHFDVYRLGSSDELYDIGFEDYIKKNGIKIIEWADLITAELPKEYIEIILYHKDEKHRVVDIKYFGAKEREGEILGYVGFRD